MKYRADIDGLRAIAVTAVTLYHAGVPGIGGGFVGVDIFFVISGYLITSLIVADLDRGSFSIAEFYDRRIRRIFPALFALLLVCTVIAYLILLPRDLDLFGQSVIATALFVSNMLFWRQAGYFDAAAEQKSLLHTWSLAVEEQFYILFPLALWLLYRLTRSARLVVVVAAAMLLLLLNVWLAGVKPDATFYLAPPRAWEFLLGSCLAMGLIGVRIERPWAVELLAGLGIGLIMGSVLLYTPTATVSGLFAVPPTVGAALLIYAGGQRPSWTRRLLESAPIVALGKISYSLYLWHWPILVFARYWLIRELRPSETCLALLLSLACAVASWRFVETPFRRWSPLPDRRSVRRAVFATGASAIAVAVACGLLMVSTHGLPERIPANVARVAAGADDKDATFGSRCSSRSVTDVTAGRLCTVGAKGSSAPSFLVWGDSHAESLIPAVDAAAAAVGRRGLVATRPGCPPLLGVGQYFTEFRAPCMAFGDAVAALLATRPEIDTVVLISRWALYATGRRFGDEGGVPVLIVDREELAGSLAANPRIFERGLARSVEALVRMGKKVVLVAQVPEVGWEVPSVVAREMLYGRQVEQVPSIGDYLARQAEVNTMFSRVKADFGVTIIRPGETLCASGQCRVIDDGRALYYDTNHLSLHGNAMLAKALEGMFGQLLAVH